MTDKERRKNSRVFFHVAATARFAGQVFENLAIKDLSLRGVFLEGVLGRRPGEKCEVVFFLAGTGNELKLHMSGKVVRQKDNGAGVHFEEIDLETFTHLQKIVAYNAEASGQVEDELVENIAARPLDV